jgi:hypothetical protein
VTKAADPFTRAGSRLRPFTTGTSVHRAAANERVLRSASSSRLPFWIEGGHPPGLANVLHGQAPLPLTRAVILKPPHLDLTTSQGRPTLGLLEKVMAPRMSRDGRLSPSATEVGCITGVDNCQGDAKSERRKDN